MRCYDTAKVHHVISTLLKNDGVDSDTWLANEENIVLENEQGDVCLFEKSIKDKVFTGHYFFKCRGKKAIETGKAFLDELFNTCYTVEVVIGLTPLDHLGARWMSRKLGFTSHGVEQINSKYYELVILTKKEFNHE